MTADDFTEAAREEARRYRKWCREGGWNQGGIGQHMAEWARTSLAAQEPTDGEVQAYLAAFSADLPPDTEWTPDTIARVKRGLSAVRAARRDDEEER